MEPLVIWHISDGRAGHDNQSLGLIEALQRQRLCLVQTSTVGSPATALGWAVTRHFPPGRTWPDPDLIIGAGRRTHLNLLSARRARGGLAIVLMRPGLPYHWFDWCLVPAHDSPPERDNILRTQGALNRMQPAADPDPGLGLILVGGPSRHHGWNEDSIMEQIETILEHSPTVRWTISDAPRTPAATSARLGRIPGATYQAFRDCPRDWLRTTLARTGTVWVSEDSVSMIYEALTAGVATGVMRVPRRKHRDRVIQGIDSLISEGRIRDFRGWLRGGTIQTPNKPLREADRCAGILLSHLPVGHPV